jgi:hypothetical protein
VIDNIRYFDHKKNAKIFLRNFKSRFFNSKFYWLQILLFLREGLQDELISVFYFLIDFQGLEDLHLFFCVDYNGTGQFASYITNMKITVGTRLALVWIFEMMKMFIYHPYTIPRFLAFLILKILSGTGNPVPYILLYH